ncbi:MAG: hypothetical protein R2747_17925 [Pyrinomonadaceae bacterium]
MKFWFSIIFKAFPLCLFCFFNLAAQDLKATVRIVSPVSGELYVEGRFPQNNPSENKKNWGFVRSLAGIGELGERISDLKLKDERGGTIGFKRLMAGEYLADDGAAIWSYRVDVRPTKQFTALAHLSWLTGERGVLMTGDLFPQFGSAESGPVSARIRFELPPDWHLITAEKRIGDNEFEVADIDKGIFLIGVDWRVRRIESGPFSLKIATAGEWLFSDDEAASMTTEIAARYGRMFGGLPGENPLVVLVPLENKNGRWEAETRGRTVLIVSGDMPFKKLSLQRLHEQLRHEIFHLWMPNNLTLTGNYDWFYEGFAVYQSLRTGIGMNRIGFADFLATLSEAFNLTDFQDQQISMIEASKLHRSGANPGVYARGMIVAFLCDAAILEKSKGKNSIEDVFRQIYAAHNRPNSKSEDGTGAILRILKSRPELVPVVERFVENAGKIDWTPYLENLGLEENREGLRVNLRVKAKLKRRQRDLLDKLGYNNWRKFSDK